MTIITNDPFDSIGYGVEWLKFLGVKPNQLIGGPIADAIASMNGSVIIVHRKPVGDVTIGVFEPGFPAEAAINSVVNPPSKN